jgi:hypothetical protein
MSFIDKLKSQRKREIEPDAPPSAFKQAGGWTAEPAETLLGPDGWISERAERDANVSAEAQIRKLDAERREANAASRLGSAPRGRDLSKRRFA